MQGYMGCSTGEVVTRDVCVLPCCVRGYHVYKAIWAAAAGEEATRNDCQTLLCERLIHGYILASLDSIALSLSLHLLAW